MSLLYSSSAQSCLSVFTIQWMMMINDHLLPQMTLLHSYKNHALFVPLPFLCQIPLISRYDVLSVSAEEQDRIHNYSLVWLGRAVIELVFKLK